MIQYLQLSFNYHVTKLHGQLKRRWWHRYDEGLMMVTVWSRWWKLEYVSYGDSDVGDLKLMTILWMFVKCKKIVDVVDQNGQNRHQHLVTL